MALFVGARPSVTSPSAPGETASTRMSCRWCRARAWQSLARFRRSPVRHTDRGHPRDGANFRPLRDLLRPRGFQHRPLSRWRSRLDTCPQQIVTRNGPPARGRSPTPQESGPWEPPSISLRLRRRSFRQSARDRRAFRSRNDNLLNATGGKRRGRWEAPMARAITRRRGCPLLRIRGDGGCTNRSDRTARLPM